LTLRRTGCRAEPTCYEFYSLDYFSSEEAALRHSARWARNWIDTRRLSSRSRYANRSRCVAHRMRRRRARCDASHAPRRRK
ncbi:hypothetical protein CA830_11475, partial [Burkholderia multivorans]